MSIRLKIVGAQKEEKSGLILFATSRSLYTKLFHSLRHCFCVFKSKVVNPEIIVFFCTRRRKCCYLICLPHIPFLSYKVWSWSCSRCLCKKVERRERSESQMVMVTQPSFLGQYHFPHENCW